MSRTLSKSVFWSIGFRSFFLSAGVFATLIIPIWLLYLHGIIQTNSYGFWWHGHEMIYGFLASVLGGFLLTAVQNWTGKPTAQGHLLFYVWVFWLIARVLPWLPALQIHPMLIAAVDVIFLPCLAVAIGIPIVSQKQVRNYGFPIALLLLGVTNVIFHWTIMSGNNHFTHLVLHVSLLLVLWIMIKLGCRVIPFFTERGLNISPLPRKPKHDIACELSVLLLLPTALMQNHFGGSPILLIITTIIILTRTREWFCLAVLRQPLIWILHTSFAWLIIALILMTLEQWNVLAGMGSWHAMTVGMMGGLTLGMMARISLGHTGRSLDIVPTTTLSFYLINIGTIARVLASYMPDYFLTLLSVSGICWMITFLCFVVVYLPILLKAKPAQMNC